MTRCSQHAIAGVEHGLHRCFRQVVLNLAGRGTQQAARLVICGAVHSGHDDPTIEGADGLHANNLEADPALGDLTGTRQRRLKRGLGRSLDDALLRFEARYGPFVEVSQPVQA